jgi:hypothetical protein
MANEDKQCIIHVYGKIVYSINSKTIETAEKIIIVWHY